MSINQLCIYKINGFNKSIPAFIFLSVLIAALLNAFIPSSMASSESVKNFKDVQTPEITDVNNINANFKDYQQSLDDLFRIAIVLNPDRNINDTIIDLNKKLIKNPTDFETLVSLGHLYRLMKLPKEANVFYEKALALKPDSFDLYFFSAITRFEVRDFLGVLDQLNHAIQIRPNDVNVWIARARTLMKLNRKDEAGLSFRKAVELDPANKEAKSLLGSFYLEQGEFKEALQIFETLPAKEPWDRYRMGYLYLANEDIKRSLEIFEKLFSENARNPSFLYQLSIAYYKNKDFEKAQKILKPLAFMNPQNHDCQFLLAMSYKEMGRLNDAIGLFREIISEDPDFLEAYIELAVTLGKTGKVEEGIEIAEQGNRRIQKIRKNFKERKDTLNRLEETIKKMRSEVKK